MITARQFKSGIFFEMEKQLCLVLGSQHIKPGKGGAFVRAKFKNVKTGAIMERTFRPTDTFPQAYIEQKKMQYLYKEHSNFFFMDQATYEQVGVGVDLIGESAKFLKDGMEITASIHKDSMVAVSLPSSVNLRITYTEPGIRGDTAKGGTKPATVETGAVVKVPLFINMDDIIKIDTRTGAYAGRA